jgi:hypothetical protein
LVSLLALLALGCVTVALLLHGTESCDSDMDFLDTRRKFPTNQKGFLFSLRHQWNIPLASQTHTISLLKIMFAWFDTISETTNKKRGKGEVRLLSFSLHDIV